MITGIGFVAVLTAAAAERFVRSRQVEEEHVREERQDLQRSLDQIVERLDALESGSPPRRRGPRGRRFHLRFHSPARRSP
jgi:hypothetical protein